MAEKKSEETVKVQTVAGSVDAVKLLVEAGVDVRYNGALLYRSGNDYRILRFDKDSNLIHNEEENFKEKELNKAVRRFADISGGKIG